MKRIKTETARKALHLALVADIVERLQAHCTDPDALAQKLAVALVILDLETLKTLRDALLQGERRTIHAS
jgi:hypothetical protein